MDPLKFCLQKNNTLELYFAGYNRWQEELLDTTSLLSRFTPDYIFIYLNFDDKKAEIKELLSCVETYSRNNKKTQFIISNINPTPYTLATYSESDDTKLFNETLMDFSKDNHKVFVFDFNRLIRWHGYKNLFDDKYWYLGRIKLSNQGFNFLAEEIRHLLNCLQGKSKKVLILDLDNTLWGGVLGEEGMAHVQLSEEGTGRIFVDFQKKIKQLKETGVLLVCCSKNNEPEVKEMFDKHPNMQLRWDDFILHKINWEQKSNNIIEIAESLQLGLDSMVFIDDCRQERALIKQMFPEVETPDFPEDISLLNQWFVLNVGYPFFLKKQLTEEDKEKTMQYQRNISRSAYEKTMRFGDFLSSLQIRLIVSEPNDLQIPRVAQLTQKTNQFNLTGKRYTDAEISAMSKDNGFKIYICNYEDKFGNEGVVGCAILKFEAENAVMDTFLLSCRVLGREVENLFLKQILNDLKQNGICRIEGIYNTTEKNVAAKDFYTKNGFISIDEQHSFLENF
jgi:FkbH-like protein